MAAFDQRRHDMAAEEAAAAGHQNVHRNSWGIKLLSNFRQFLAPERGQSHRISLAPSEAYTIRSFLKEIDGPVEPNFLLWQIFTAPRRPMRFCEFYGFVTPSRH